MTELLDEYFIFFFVDIVGRVDQANEISFFLVGRLVIRVVEEMLGGVLYV